MKPTPSNMRHYVTLKKLGDKRVFFLWKILLYKPVEAYVPIKSTRPVILNSSRQAQNLLLLQLWLFVRANKKCHGCFELSSACKCANQHSDSSVHSHLMWKTRAELGARKAHLSGVSCRKSVSCVQRQGSSTKPWREICSAVAQDWIIQLILLLSVTKQWLQQRNDIC